LERNEGWLSRVSVYPAGCGGRDACHTGGTVRGDAENATVKDIFFTVGGLVRWGWREVEGGRGRKDLPPPVDVAAVSFRTGSSLVQGTAGAVSGSSAEFNIRGIIRCHEGHWAKQEILLIA